MPSRNIRTQDLQTDTASAGGKQENQKKENKE